MQEFVNSEILGLLTGYQALIIVHLFGLALGAGSAFFSDFLFTHILKDRVITDEELGFLKLASLAVWLGLAVLAVSGLLIFLGFPDRLSASPKFLAKMTIIGVLTINGLLFHFKHVPFLEKFTNQDLRMSVDFWMKSKGFFISGAVSGVSWAFAIILGGMPFINYSYFVIMAVYAMALVPAIYSGIWLHKKFLS